MARVNKSKRRPTIYGIVPIKPVARFYYQGSHSHPVRRTILIIEDNEDTLVGYELREGRIIRDPLEALKCIKTYKKSRIARWGDYSRLRMTSKTALKNPKRTTLERFPIVAMFTGV